MKNGDVHYVQNGDADGDDERNNIDDISISSATCSRTMNLHTSALAQNSKTYFKIIATAGRARHGQLSLAHGAPVDTPVFMPVGTQGTMKGITPDELQKAGCQILLANTYHLADRPGDELIKRGGGLHKWIHWPNAILTDSGGFQMVSLGKLMSVTENGVEFESPHTGERTLLTPERCIQLQENIGSDIAMQLDHVIPSLTQGPLVEEASLRSIRWLDRCISAKTLSDEQQALFPIIQGGLDLKLREHCAREMIKRARVGIAIGGLSGGEAKDTFWKIVARCCEIIPNHLPTYVMGVGWPIDLIVASVLGADMFDCVWPTRTARFGTAITRYEKDLHLSKAEFRNDMRPIDEHCLCETCKAGYSRAFLHSNIGAETFACHLISIHNIYHHLDLMRRFRQSIDQGTLESFLTEFLREQFGSKDKVPTWVQDAITYAGHGNSIDAIDGTKLQQE